MNSNWRYVSEEIINIFSTINKEYWLNTRNSIKYSVSGSKMPIFYGYGYKSLNKFIQERGIEVTSSYTQKCMEYGSGLEKEAKEYLLSCFNYNIIADGENTIHKKLTYKSGIETKSVDILLTPDLVLCEIDPPYKDYRN